MNYQQLLDLVSFMMEAHEFILQFHQFLKTKQKDFVEHLIKIKVMILRLLKAVLKQMQ